MDNTLCIVMRTADWRDADKMLTLFSRDYGLLSALARGAKSLKNPIAAASQPFCCGVYTFSGRNGRLYVSQCEIKKEFYSLGSDFEKYAAACVMMEMTEKILQNTDEYDPLFILLGSCLTHLEKGNGLRETLTYFLVRLSGLLGIRPSTRICVACGNEINAPSLFCAREGGVVCTKCTGGLETRPVLPDDMQRIEKMLATPPKEFKASAGFDNRLLELMREYMGILGELKCRSMQFL